MAGGGFVRIARPEAAGNRIIREGLPTRLRLHRAHLGSKCPVPLDPRAVTGVVRTRSAWPWRTFSLTGSACRPEESACLVFGDDRSGEAPAFSIPLLLSQVAAGTDLVTQEIVIMVSARGSNGCIWLLEVDGEEAFAREALAQLGAAGAVLSDPWSHCEVQDEPLAVGGFATVHRATLVQTSANSLTGRTPFVQEDVVVKVWDEQEDEPERSMPDVTLEREAKILAAVQGHTNVVQMRGIFVFDADSERGSSPTRGMVLHFCPRGDLFNLVLGGPLQEEHARQIMEGTLSALAHIHSMRVVHRDVKPENILLESDGRAVLADFSVAALLSEDSETLLQRCGTPGYIAPEVLLGRGCTPKVDSFGAGGVLYFALSREGPFRSSSLDGTIRRTLTKNVRFAKAPFTNISASCKKLALALLDKDPASRLEAASALADPWIEERESQARRFQPADVEAAEGAVAASGKRLHEDVQASCCCGMAHSAPCKHLLSELAVA